MSYQNNNNYRSEIDGVRAVAILAVVLYHSETNTYFKGGFFGVDVFFVISGYLITRLLLNEYYRKKTIDLTDFFIRRVRRLLPVLLVVILVTFPFAYIYILPESFIEYSKSILSSLVFSSNLFWFFNASYGDNPALLKPFLHIWSLSVEEQYYFIYPITLLITLKYFTKYTLHFLSTLLITSLASYIYIQNFDPYFSFYMMPTRIWELMIGGVVAYLLYHNYLNKFSFIQHTRILNNVLPISGMLMIAYSIHYFQFSGGRVGNSTLIPVLGTAIFIFFSNPNDIVTKFLSTKPFVGLGLISYSLYLWHYTIFSIGSVAIDNPTIEQKIAAILLAVIMSILTYKFVEEPFRSRSFIRTEYVLALIISTVLLISSVLIYAISTDGLLHRYTYDPYNPEPLHSNKERGLFEKKNSLIQKTKKNKITNVLFIGNSHGRGLYNAFELNRDLFVHNQFTYLHINIVQLPKALNDPIYSSKFKDADVIVLATRWSTADVDNLNNAIKYIYEKKKKIVVVLHKPQFDYKYKSNQTFIDRFVIDAKRKNSLWVSSSLDLQEKFGNKFYRARSTGEEGLNKRIKSISAGWDWTLGYSYVSLLNPFDFACSHSTQSCDVITEEGEKIYFDYAHFTLAGSKYFGKKIYESNWFKIIKK